VEVAKYLVEHGADINTKDKKKKKKKKKKTKKKKKSRTSIF